MRAPGSPCLENAAQSNSNLQQTNMSQNQNETIVSSFYHKNQLSRHTHVIDMIYLRILRFETTKTTLKMSSHL